MGAEENMLKELDLIQNCITRMADYSFRIKEFYIALVAVIVVYFFVNDICFVYPSLGIIILSFLFGIMDCNYLRTERRYRWKYSWVIENRKNTPEKYLFDLDPNNKEMQIMRHTKDSWASVILSWSILPLYGLPVIFSFFVFIYRVCK